MFRLNLLKNKALRLKTLLPIRSASKDARVENVSLQAIGMWLLATTFVMLQFILQLATGILVKPLMEAFHLSPGVAGALVGSYYIFYVLMQTPVGYLLDRYGLRCLLSIGALVCAIGCFLFVATHSLWMALLGRILMGFGASVAFVGCLKVVVHWFPERRIALMTALLESFGITCVLIYNAMSAHWMSLVGWRWIVAGVGLPLTLLSLLVALFMRETPEGVPKPPLMIRGWKQVWHACCRYLFPNPLLWLNGLCAGLLFSVVTVFGALWGVPFLMVSHHLALTAVTSDLNAILLGILIGCPIMGWLVSQDGITPGLVMSLSAFFTGVLLLVFLFSVSIGAWSLRVLCFALGLVASSYVVSFMLAARGVPQAVRSVSFGFLNTLMVLVVPILQPVMGRLLSFFAHQHQHGSFSRTELLHYSVSSYQDSMSILPILLILCGIACWFYLRRPKLTNWEQQENLF